MTHSESLIPLSPAQAAHFVWADEGAAQKVMAALEAAAPGASRFVGGCVRDSLFGQTPKDIDIATQLTPDAVTTAMHEAGLGAAPTGVEHGTITGIADHVGVEVTTLRADVSTDGRRATVAFTDDWATDAARRDFTMNALYLTPDKKLYDPVNGLPDAENSVVRFIGAAEMRIKEDYLRILRFFRFSARFAQDFDAAGLEACSALKGGMAGLSAERIGDEFTKILSLPAAANAVAAMERTGVLSMVWPRPADVSLLQALKERDAAAPPELALAALFGDRDRDSDNKTIDTALRLSKAFAERRKAAVKNAALIDADMSDKDARATLYRLGVESWSDAVALAQARARGGDDTWRRLRKLPDSWRPPTFCIGGKDVLALGVPKGPQVADVLKRVEDRWIEEDFPDAARARALLVEAVEALQS